MDLTNPRLIYLKGFLFLLAALLASGILLFEHASLRFVMLLAIAIFCACRFYYFAFYVIEHYVDGNYKFAGLWSFFCYFAKRRSRENKP